LGPRAGVGEVVLESGVAELVTAPAWRSTPRRWASSRKVISRNGRRAPNARGCGAGGRWPDRTLPPRSAAVARSGQVVDSAGWPIVTPGCRLRDGRRRAGRSQPQRHLVRLQGVVDDRPQLPAQGLQVGVLA